MKCCNDSRNVTFILLLVTVLLSGFAHSKLMAAGTATDWVILFRSSTPDYSYSSSYLQIGTATGRIDGKDSTDSKYTPSTGPNARIVSYESTWPDVPPYYLMNKRAPLTSSGPKLWELRAWVGEDYPQDTLRIAWWSTSTLAPPNNQIILQMFIRIVSDPTGTYQPGQILSYPLGASGTSTSPVGYLNFNNVQATLRMPDADAARKGIKLELIATPWIEYPPMPPIVTDSGKYTSSTSTLTASWMSQDDLVSGGKYAIGTAPDDPGSAYTRDWTYAGNNITATGLSLIPGQTYYFYARCQEPYYDIWSAAASSDGITVAFPSSVGQARTSYAGQPVFITDAVATSTPSYPCGLWVESSDRSAAIKVPADWQVAPGDRLQLAGVPVWQDGTPVLSEPELKSKLSGMELRPVGMNTGKLAADRRENLYYRGPNPVGLLATTFGKVLSVDLVNRFFYIDDGSGLADGTGPEAFPHTGLRINYSSDITPPYLHDYVRVTGIRTVEKVVLTHDAAVNREVRSAGETLYIPILSIRDQKDIVTYQH